MVTNNLTADDVLNATDAAQLSAQRRRDDAGACSASRKAAGRSSSRRSCCGRRASSRSTAGPARRCRRSISPRPRRRFRRKTRARAARGGRAVVPALSAGVSRLPEARRSSTATRRRFRRRISSTACSPARRSSIEIERGKTLIVRYLTTGEVREDGTRTVFFELNGQPREVTRRRPVGRRRRVKRHPKADPDNAESHRARRCPARCRRSRCGTGRRCKAGERLLSIEAMKMETAVYSPRDAKVSAIHVDAGTVVEARDLLLVLGE